MYTYVYMYTYFQKDIDVYNICGIRHENSKSKNSNNLYNQNTLSPFLGKSSKTIEVKLGHFL